MVFRTLLKCLDFRASGQGEGETQAESETESSDFGATDSLTPCCRGCS
jgi:hypothetical protein